MPEDDLQLLEQVPVEPYADQYSFYRLFWSACADGKAAIFNCTNPGNDTPYFDRKTRLKAASALFCPASL
jgi:hypothetical protein